MRREVIVVKKSVKNTQSIYELEPIMAMAIINPRLCKTKSIRVELVQSGEGNKAHVHVYWNGGAVSYVDLTACKYAEHHHEKKGVPLNRKTRDEFVEIMSSIWDNYALQLFVLDDNGEPTNETYFTKATGYEAAVQIWMDTYGNDIRFKLEKNGRPIMPDYSQLPLSL